MILKKSLGKGGGPGSATGLIPSDHNSELAPATHNPPAWQKTKPTGEMRSLFSTVSPANGVHVFHSETEPIDSTKERETESGNQTRTWRKSYTLSCLGRRAKSWLKHMNLNTERKQRGLRMVRITYCACVTSLDGPSWQSLHWNQCGGRNTRRKWFLSLEQLLLCPNMDNTNSPDNSKSCGNYISISAVLHA